MRRPWPLLIAALCMGPLSGCAAGEFVEDNLTTLPAEVRAPRVVLLVERVNVTATPCVRDAYGPEAAWPCHVVDVRFENHNEKVDLATGPLNWRARSVEGRELAPVRVEGPAMVPAGNNATLVLRFALAASHRLISLEYDPLVARVTIPVEVPPY